MHIHEYTLIFSKRITAPNVTQLAAEVFIFVLQNKTRIIFSQWPAILWSSFCFNCNCNFDIHYRCSYCHCHLLSYIPFIILHILYSIIYIIILKFVPFVVRLRAFPHTYIYGCEYMCTIFVYKYISNILVFKWRAYLKYIPTNLIYVVFCLLLCIIYYLAPS